MKNIFISQPIRGKSYEEIISEREYVKFSAERMLGEEVQIIESFNTNDDMEPLECLGDAIKLLACADWAWFCDGWDEAIGCKIEFTCAIEYGIKILHS